MSVNPGEQCSEGELAIPLSAVGTFVRQLSHDVRNHLGSMDLQAAYVAELITDPEAAAELKKLRAMVMSSARSIQGVSSQFSVPKPNVLTLEAGILFQDFQDRLLKLFPEDAPRIQWTEELGEAQVVVDLEMMFTTMAEICRNAFYFHEGADPLEGRLSAAGGRFVFELREKRAVLDGHPECWGLTPLVTTRRGGYGLGLFQARRLLEIQSGKLEFERDAAAGTLVARIILPLAEPS